MHVVLQFSDNNVGRRSLDINLQNILKSLKEKKEKKKTRLEKQTFYHMTMRLIVQ